MKHNLIDWRHLLLSFIAILFFVSVNFVVYFQFAPYPDHAVTLAGALTFGNVIFMSFLTALAYSIWHMIHVERPVKKILSATDAVTKGDLNTHIDPIHTDENRKNEFDQIIDNFNVMVKELSSTETLRTDFISNVSHEIKTPLAVISNYATLLKDPSLTEEKRMEYASSIQESTKKLSTLITNILKLNKLENQQIFPDFKEYDVSEQLTVCLLNYESVWEEKNIDIEANIEEGLKINGDEELMSLVFNNLISNALKFTEPGGIVRASAKKSEKEITISVTDTGCGMDEKTARHVFDKFYQGDSSHSGEGNGLGLALAKRVIDIHNASIDVESKVNEGSTFTVHFPIQ